MPVFVGIGGDAIGRLVVVWSGLNFRPLMLLRKIHRVTLELEVALAVLGIDLLSVCIFYDELIVA